MLEARSSPERPARAAEAASASVLVLSSASPLPAHPAIRRLLLGDPVGPLGPGLRRPHLLVRRTLRGMVPLHPSASERSDHQASKRGTADMAPQIHPHAERRAPAPQISAGTLVPKPPSAPNEKHPDHPDRVSMASMGQAENLPFLTSSRGR